MNYRYYFLFLFLLTVVGCARMGRPEGGPKDFDKPIMVRADPEFESLRFNSDQIRIYFDEYIKLKDVNSQLIISPPLKNQPVISPLGSSSKRITIKLADTLQDNTTYTFNFAQSIEDNTEGNVLENFKYIFSTGDYIDSLSIGGTIKDAFELEMLENPTIMLYPVNENYKDSVIFEEKPTYVGGVLDSINWEISNIKAGSYKLVALNDIGKNYKYNPKQDKIAFHSGFINIPGDSLFDLNLFKENLPFKLVSRPKEVSKGKIILGFEGESENVDIKVLSSISDDFASFYTKDRNSDTLNYWFNNFGLDSLVLEVSKDRFRDTVNIKIDEEEIDSLDLKLSTTSLLHLRDTLKLGSTVPIMKLDTSKFHFLDKDSVRVPLKLNIASKRDRIDFEFEKEPQQSYQLLIEPGAVEDILGIQNDSIKSTIKTGKTSDYCSLFLSVGNIKRYPIILDLINDRGQLISRTQASEEQEFVFRNLRPSRFMIRIIYDDNGNGVWDTGDFLKDIHPEEVRYVKSIIEAKANWEVEERIMLRP
jgi:uncharacterized protein (DUF2141 family)